jgi:hypothetical protein
VDPNECVDLHKRWNSSRRSSRRGVGALALWFAVAGFVSCVQEEFVERPPPNPSWASGPQGTLVASMVLREDDSLHISFPGSFTLDECSGDIFIADRRLPRVVRFTREGAPVRVYPRRDAQRLELLDAAAIAIADGTLFVADLVDERMVGFDLVTGTRVSSAELPGWVGVSFPQPKPELWVGMHFRGATREDPHGARVWRVGDGLRLDLPLPEEFFEFPSIKAHSGLNVIEHGGYLLLGYAALEPLLRMTMNGEVTDTLVVPALARRGVQKAALEKSKMDLLEVSLRASRMVLLDEGSDGNVVLVHFESEMSPLGKLTTGVLVSVLTPDLRQACPDGRIFLASETIPNVHFASDTLWFQTTESEEGERYIRLSGYRLTTDHCEWLPVQRGSSLILP